nr:aminotransferase class I/II-fold pyridoxal phosphate-dependent enzyme [Nocardioides convexus]
MYPEYARDTHTRWVAGHRAEDFSIDLDAAHDLVKTEQPGVVLLPSPNNPTGTALPHDAIGVLCEAAGDGLVVVDEAYGEFRRTGVPSALDLLPTYRNLVVTRTMSKAFAGAGLRLGYLAAAPEICDAIRVVRLPYHLSALTQAVALAALKHAPEPARPGRRACAPSGTGWSRGCAPRGTTWPTRTPISCCSGDSPTVMLSGRVSSTGES